MNSCLYECSVLHARFSPRQHRFVYRIFLFAIDLDELTELHRRLPLFSVARRNLYSFRDRDYLPTTEPLHNAPTGSAGGPPAISPTESPPLATPENLKSRVLAHLSTHTPGLDLTGARVVLVTLPRIFGYLFNPVSFYFCYDRHGAPLAALAEVTNTFKEMKPYVLGPATRLPAPLSPTTSTSDLPTSTGEGRASAPPNTSTSPRSPTSMSRSILLSAPPAKTSPSRSTTTSAPNARSPARSPARAAPSPPAAWRGSR